MHSYWIRDRVRQGQFQIYGVKDKQTSSTIFLNTIMPPISRLYVPCTCIPLRILRGTFLNVLPIPRVLPRLWPFLPWTLVRVCSSPRSSRRPVTRLVNVTTLLLRPSPGPLKQIANYD
jgi:hypothetical protein